MTKPACHFTAIITFFFIFFFAIPPLSTHADNLYDKHFSLRLPAALSRFSSYADVAAGGGASAGSPWQSSINPAAVYWEIDPDKKPNAFTPQYSNLNFDEGLDLDITSQTLTIPTQNNSAIQPTFAQVRSNRKNTRQGLGFEIDIDLAQIQWGIQLSDTWALGFNLNYSHAETNFFSSGINVADTDDDTYGARIGILHKPAERLLAGIVLDYAQTRSQTQFPNTTDTAHQFRIQPGISYQYGNSTEDDSRIFLDYQFAYFTNNSGLLRTHRLFTGIDHQLTKGLFGRTGMSLDNFGNTSWTTGVGIYALESATIDIGYQYDFFPEIQPEFGQSQLLSISVTIGF